MMYSNKEGWMIALRQERVGGDAAISPTTTTWLLVLKLQLWMPDCNLATFLIVSAIEEDLLKEKYQRQPESPTRIVAKEYSEGNP